MRQQLFLCLVAVLVCLWASSEAGTINKIKIPSLKGLMQRGRTEVMQQASKINRVMQQSARMVNEKAKLTVECALCGIAVNEVEGFLAENLTVEAIEFEMTKFCSFMGLIQDMCDSLVQQLPAVIARIEQQWSVSAVCMELGFCEIPFTPYPDPQAVPTYVVNLDLAPEQRWTTICKTPLFQETAQFLVNAVDTFLSSLGGGSILNEIGEILNEYYFPTEYAKEIQGCAASLGVPTGWATLFNLGYEVSDACTSIVAQTSDGTIIHARNLDFWAGMGFTDSLKDMAFIADFQKGGKTMYKTTGFAGYVGALSGIKPGGFSVTIDTRFYRQGVWEMFYEILAAIEETNSSLVSFLTRDVLNRRSSFETALMDLSNTELIADVYYILAGVKPGQGAVISRNRYNATDVWRLNAPSQWYVIETNYDHWEQPPWFDNRVVPAERVLNSIGQSQITMGGLMKVLSTKPVFNLQTTYTIMAIPKNSTYMSWTRWCPYPCVE